MTTMDGVPSATTAAANGGIAPWPATSAPSAFGHASSHLHELHHQHHHLLSAGNPFGTSLSAGIAARMNESGASSSAAAAATAAFAPFPPVAYEEHQRHLLLQHQRGRDEPMMMVMVPVSSVTGGTHAPSLAYPTMAPSAHINAMYASTLTPRVLLAAGEAPVYVNARQYHAILRRRRARAREEARNRTTGQRKVYPSRSAHAKRRLRGATGAFLTREEVLAGAALTQSWNVRRKDAAHGPTWPLIQIGDADSSPAHPPATYTGPHTSAGLRKAICASIVASVGAAKLPAACKIIERASADQTASRYTRPLQ